VTSVPSRRLGVLVSGRGSNLQALIDAIADGRLTASIAVVISNVAGAGGLDRARHAGIETAVLDHRAWPTRDDYDRALADALRAHAVDVVCLAGFMRRIGPSFIAAFPDRIVNVHPSLLPSFPGLRAQRQALAHGVKVSGVTVHLVTAELDAGPIVVQRAVPVLESDTEETLAARILVEEHHAYPEAVQQVLDGHWTVHGRRFVARPVAGTAD
jgi:phosphoribosylglycinamide formyltransferase 1